MLIGAYVVAGLLEIVGIGLVVLDVRDDRRRSQRLGERYLKLRASTTRSGSDMALLQRRGSTDDTMRVLKKLALDNDRRLRYVEKNSEQDAELIKATVMDMLSPSLMRRRLGPALLVLGIVIGTVANIAAGS